MSNGLAVEKLSRNSRRYAFLSLAGFLIIIAAFLYSFKQLSHLESIREQKLAEISELDNKKSDLETQLTEVEERLRTANQKAQILNSVVNQVSRTDKGAQSTIQQTIESNPAAAEILPRVYIEIRDEGQRARATEIAKVLEEHQYLIPRFEVVGENMPNKAQVRYYRESETAEVNAIVQILKGVNLQAEPKLMTGISDKARPRHYELWLGLSP
jgi:hypothetical protein